VNGTDVVYAVGVSRVTTGTDQNGNYMIDVVFDASSAFGFRSAWEYRSSTGAAWSPAPNLWNSAWGDQVVALGKGRQELVDVTFVSGNAWEHDATGYTNYLGPNVFLAV
jgi:hypothetical protein